MIPVVTASEMNDAERKAFIRISPESAMFEAGAAVFERIKHFKRILIICNHGNNGGDGFACASLAEKAGINTEIIFFGDKERLSPHARSFFEHVTHLIVNKPTGEYDCIVDAIFGIGFHGILTGKAREYVEYINSSSAYKLAVDIPSGLNATTGEAEYALYADETVTFGGIKQGLLINKGAEHCGKITFAPINIQVCSDVHYIEKSDIHLPKIKSTAHKGTMGHLGVIAGSFGMEGAGALCAASALRCSAGKVSLCVPEECTRFYFNRAPEVMLTVRKSISEFIKDKDCVVYGPGIGRNEDNRQMLEELLCECTCPLVIDADGLYFLTTEILKNAKCPVTVTPHLGEAARLFNCKINELILSPIDFARSFSQKTGAVVLLKSNYNVIAHNNDGFIASFGCPGMATAGSGDVLAGICGGLTMLYKNNLTAAIAASYIHGASGCFAQKEKTAYAMTASDISENIYKVLNSIKITEYK